MKSNALAPLLIFLGILLLALSFFWPSLGASQTNWTPEKAERKKELVRFQHGGGAKFFPADKEAANKEFEQLQNELKNAQEGPTKIASVFQWIGIGLVVIGIVVFFSQREQPG